MFYNEFLDTFMTPEIAKMMKNDPYMMNRFKALTKKYRCKVCGKETEEKSDARRVCPTCRKEYLKKGAE